MVTAAREVVTLARSGRTVEALAHAQAIKVLAAVRQGPGGLFDWTDRIVGGVRSQLAGPLSTSAWYAGRPVMVTGNDPSNGVFNGDVGVTVEVDGVLVVAFPAAGDDVRLVVPARLSQVEDWWAMTIHKSQGSEFDHAVVSLPSVDSTILSRQLLYTAVTRAKELVTVVADEAALRGAIDRPVTRASGLRRRLWGVDTVDAPERDR